MKDSSKSSDNNYLSHSIRSNFSLRRIDYSRKMTCTCTLQLHIVHETLCPLHFGSHENLSTMKIMPRTIHSHEGKRKRSKRKEEKAELSRKINFQSQRNVRRQLHVRKCSLLTFETPSKKCPCTLSRILTHIRNSIEPTLWIRVIRQFRKHKNPFLSVSCTYPKGEQKHRGDLARARKSDQDARRDDQQ